IVARRLIPSEGREEMDDNADESSMAIRGAEGMLMTFAKCCHPIPGDTIVGYISAGRGMIVHRETCNNVAEIRNDPKKYVNLRWDPTVGGEFAVELRVELEHQRGIIATLANIISGAEANIEKIDTSDRDAQFSIVTLTMTVRNRVHLAKVLKKVRMLKPVTRVTRVKH
ncbi:MAG: ACT domain-containing protein, partial [Gammaproteobacteria bacterium]